MEKHDTTLQRQYGFWREKSFQRTHKFVFKSDPANANTQIFKKHLTMSLIQKAFKTTKLTKDREESPPEDS